MAMYHEDTFYEHYRKGKSKEEIFNIIEKLKERITTLKLGIEDPRYEIFIISPGFDVQIAMNRRYLKKAIEGYLEVGGKYNLSDAEKKTVEFQNNIDFIKKIKLDYNKEYYTIFLDDIDIEKRKKKNIEVLYRGKTYPIKSLWYNMETGYLTHHILLLELKKLYLGEWESFYDIKRFSITPKKVIKWKVTFEYHNSDDVVTYKGVNDYPHNFYNFLSLFAIEDKFKREVVK